MIALLAALDERNLIGVGGRLPWRFLSADMRHFRALTMGKVVVMGRKTYENIRHPLAGRTNFVLSTTKTWRDFPQGCFTASSLTTPMAHCNGRDIMVIGGASVYAQALPLADRLYLTRIHHTFPTGDGAVYFPEWSGFTLAATEQRAVDAENPWAMDFEEWRRA